MTVLPLSLALGSLTLPRSNGVSRSMGARRSFENVLPISKVGWTIRMGDGSCEMKYPMTFSMTEVLPICALDMTTTVSAVRSVTASIIPF